MTSTFVNILLKDIADSIMYDIHTLLTYTFANMYFYY